MLKLPHPQPNHPIFSVTLLWPYNNRSITEQVQHNLPPPVVHDGGEKY